MKKRRVWLILLAAVLLFSSSCQKTPNGEGASSDSETVKQPEPQHMAYHLSESARVGDDIFFVSGVSFDKAQIFAAEYGSEDFEAYIPCFDAVCDHLDRTICCIATDILVSHTDKLAALIHDNELSVLLFNPIDICFSKPYSNYKVNLVVEDFVIKGFPENDADIPEYMNAVGSKPTRKDPFIYRDYFYYYEIKNGARTQYRIPLTGGNPERVFEEYNIIVKTIINDRFYGIRYEKDDEDNTQMYYFRSDMNYENVEALPEILDFFELPNKDNLRLTANIILDADQEFIYVMHDMKFWKIPDSDINAEPILLSDMTEKLPSELPDLTWDRLWYNNGVFYTVLNTNKYQRSVLNAQGNTIPSIGWYERSTLYSFDIRTGECNTCDMSNPSYLICRINYADDKDVYAEGKYVHDDNRAIQGVTMRLTLDTMRYEVILPDRFWEYSAETTAN